MNLYQAFIQSADQYPERTALLWEGGAIHYTELKRRVHVMVELLASRVTPEMPNIGLLIPNTPNFPPALLGILGAAGVAVPFNPLCTPEELATLIRHSGLHVLLIDPLVQSKAEALKSELGAHALDVIDVDNVLTTHSELPSITKRALPGDAELSMILYTSGTTGDPKGVMLSHGNVFSNYDQFRAIFNFNSTDTFQVVLPMFHTFAMTVNLFGGLLVGAALRLYVQFEPKKLLEHVGVDENCILTAVPPMLLLMARLAPEGYPQSHHLRHIVSGGGPLPREVADIFQAKIGMELLEGYGLTETSPVVSTNRPGRHCPGSIGYPIDGAEVEVRNEAGDVLPHGEVGELCVRGPMVMMGYYKSEAATRAVLSEDGWLRTGDLATINANGTLSIVGRCKDLIIDSGENIYPREVEEILVRHPAVMEAAVVGRPHRIRGEVPYAFVTKRPEAPAAPDAQELRAFCREHLAAYKIPEGFEVIEQFQKTATNKIQKEKLRERLRNKEA